MQTDDRQIQSLVSSLAASAKSVFSGRRMSVFVMGSLARGGFSRTASDIDMGIVFDGPLSNSDGADIETLRLNCLSQHPLVANKLSIFWGSIESINGTVDGGRYPPFDRLDLIEYGLLIAGSDFRSRLLRPSRKELEVCGAEFAISKLGSETKIEEFNESRVLATKPSPYLAKIILFPARFIYLAATGLVASNEASRDYYIKHFSGPDAALVFLGYELRFDLVSRHTKEVENALYHGLVPLYRRFLQTYIARMEVYGESETLCQLEEWKRQLKGSPAAH